MLGDNVMLLSGAAIDASGDGGGGVVQVGGDFHGPGTTPTALTATCRAARTIKADAVTSGNGGDVAVWADNDTEFAGFISARGGSQSGDGGYVETSGHQFLSLADGYGHNGMVDASAPNGFAGTWLLDPADLRHHLQLQQPHHRGQHALGGQHDLYPQRHRHHLRHPQHHYQHRAQRRHQRLPDHRRRRPGRPQRRQHHRQQRHLGHRRGMALTTTGNLTLSSYNAITVNAGITLGGGTNLSSATVTGGSLTLDADNHNNGSGYIKIGAAIATNGGNITLGGGNGTITAGSGYATGISGQAYGIEINNVAVSANGTSQGGSIVMNGRGWNGTGNGNDGIYLNGASGRLTTNNSGTISMSGIGQGSGNSTTDYGVFVNNGAQASTVNGNLTIGYNTTGGGAGTGSSNYGVYVASANSTIAASGTGNISITARGGDSGGNGTNNYGIYVYNSGLITGGGGAMIFKRHRRQQHRQLRYRRPAIQHHQQHQQQRHRHH